MDPKDPLAESSRKEDEKTHWLSRKRENGEIPKDNKAKDWFCTWPDCPVPKEVALIKLEQLGLEEYVIAEEKHKDGKPHLHAFLKLKNRVRFSKTRFDITDLGVTYHGHYEICKSWRAVQSYCTKEENYISNIDIKQAQNKKSKKIGIKELEMNAMDLLRDNVISGFQLCQFLKNQSAYQLLKQKEQANLLIELNVEKKRHHWTFGPSNCGKTYKLRQMIQANPQDWFQIPTNNDWIGYNNEKNLYLDEYKGQLSVQELNRICDGGAKVNVKGGTTILHPSCIVWINSNFSIEKCYNKVEPELITALHNRFIVEEMQGTWIAGFKCEIVQELLALGDEKKDN